MTLAHVETRIIDICPPGWCWSRLAEADEGVLTFTTPQGRVALTVPYTVTDQQIAIPMATFDPAVLSAADGEATLEVIGVATENQRWLVRATGTAQPAGSPGAPGSDWLMLPPIRLRGYYETSIRWESADAFGSSAEPLPRRQP